MIGMAGVVIHAALFISSATGLPAIPEISLSWKDCYSARYVGVYGADCGAGRYIIEKIPGVNRIKFSADDIQRNLVRLASLSPWVL